MCAVATPSPSTAAADAAKGAAPADSRPKVLLDDLSGSLTGALQHSRGAEESAAHSVSCTVLALQDELAEGDAVPPDLSARLATVGVQALCVYEAQGQSSTEALLLEACLCSLAHLTCEPFGVLSSPPSAVPAEAVRLALRALSCRFSAAITSHSAAILASVAQSQEGWSRILAAWRAETADGRGDAKAAVAADAGALCEQLLVLVCSQFGSHATTGAGVPGRGCHDVDTADQGGETCRADAIVGPDEAAASAGVTVSSWAELEAAEAAHQLESALTSCVQIAGFLGCAATTGSPGAAAGAMDAVGAHGGAAHAAGASGCIAQTVGAGEAVCTAACKTVAGEAARAEARAAAAAAASSVAGRTSLRARLLLIASGVEPKLVDGTGGGTEGEEAAVSVCTRVAESAQTVLAILLAADGWTRPLRPCSLTDLIAEIADRLAATDAEEDPLLLSAVLLSFAALGSMVDAGVTALGGDGGGVVRSSAAVAGAMAPRPPDEAKAPADGSRRSRQGRVAPGPAAAGAWQPEHRPMGAAALKLLADAAARAAPGTTEQVLALRAIAAGCSAAAPEAIHSLAPELLSFLFSIVAQGEAAADASDAAGVVNLAQARDAAEAAIGALRKGWVAAPDWQRRGAAGGAGVTGDGCMASVNRLLDLAGPAAGGDGRLAAWALDLLGDMALDPATRPELIEGGALLLVARLAALSKATGRGVSMARHGTVKAQGMSRTQTAEPAGLTGARTLGRGGQSGRQPVPPADANGPADASRGDGSSSSLPRNRGRLRSMSAARAAWESDDTPDSHEIPHPPTANASATVTARARADSVAWASQPRYPHIDARPGAAASPPFSPSRRTASTRAMSRGSSSALAAPADTPWPPTASRAGVSREASARRLGESHTGGGDNGGHPSALAALRAWLSYSDAGSLPSTALDVPTSTLCVLCRLAGGTFEPNSIDGDAASLALCAVRTLLGARCDEGGSNAGRLRDLVLAEPRRVPAEPDPTACIEVMLSLLDEEAAHPTKLDDSALAPRLLCVLQGAVEHRKRMQSTLELDGPLHDRFSSIARFVAATGSAGAGEKVTARAVNLARGLCEGWAGPRSTFLRERAALFATSSLLGHPAESVQQQAMLLLLSLSTGDRKAVASLVATGAVQASLDVISKALLDPSPEAKGTATAATSFLRNLVARERSVLRLLREHPACEGIQWPKF